MVGYGCLVSQPVCDRSTAARLVVGISGTLAGGVGLLLQLVIRSVYVLRGVRHWIGDCCRARGGVEGERGRVAEAIQWRSCERTMAEGLRVGLVAGGPRTRFHQPGYRPGAGVTMGVDV